MANLSRGMGCCIFWVATPRFAPRCGKVWLGIAQASPHALPRDISAATLQSAPCAKMPHGITCQLPCSLGDQGTAAQAATWRPAIQPCWTRPLQAGSHKSCGVPGSASETTSSSVADAENSHTNQNPLCMLVWISAWGRQSPHGCHSRASTCAPHRHC